MNKIFKVVWSKSKQCYVVVSEIAKNTTGKKKIIVASILATLAMQTVSITNVHAINDTGNGTQGSVAIGYNSQAKGTTVSGVVNPSVAVGTGSYAEGNSALALGTRSWAKGSYNVSVGREATSSQDYGIAIGYQADVSAIHGMALGERAGASGQIAVAVGANAKATGANSYAGGFNSASSGTSSVALGESATSSGENSVAIGKNTVASGGDGVSIGASSQATGGDSVALGKNAKASNGDAIAIGQDSEANNLNAVALGKTSKATGASATALGPQSTASATFATAIGMSSVANKDYAIAIGGGSEATVERGVALGTYSKANTAKGVAGYDANADANRTNTYAGLTGKALTSTWGAVSIGDSTNTRQITGLAAGKEDTDAVNVAQLKSVNLAFTGDNSTKGDVNLANSKLAITGDTTYITTTAANQGLAIKGVKKDITVSNGTASASAGMADAKNVAEAINKANADQTISYKANSDTANKVKVSDGLNFTNGTTTVATVGANGQVSFDLNTTTKQSITDSSTAVNRTIALGSSSGSTTAKKLASGDVKFNIKGQSGTNTLITTSATGDDVTIAPTAKLTAAVTAAENAANKDLSNLSTAGNTYIKNLAKTASAWNVSTNGSGATAVSGGDTVNFVNGDNIAVTNTGRTIKIGTAKNVSFDNVTVGGLSIDKTNGINAGNKEIKGVIAGTTATSAVNKQQMDDAVKAASDATAALGKNTIALVSDSGSTSAKKLSTSAITFNIKGDTGANALITTSATGDNVSITPTAKLTAAVSAAENASDKNLSNISTSGKTVIKDLAKGAAQDAVKVAGTGLANVTDSTTGGVKTYTVDVNTGNLVVAANGQVGAAGATGASGATGSNGVATTQNVATAINDAVTKAKASTTQALADAEHKFAGDTGTTSVRKHGEVLSIKGGVASSADLATGNIGVVSDGAGTLNIRLAKVLSGLTSATFTTTGGNTTVINSDGVTITPSAVGASAISMTTAGINAGNKEIKGVATGTTADAAVNKAQMDAAITAAAGGSLSTEKVVAKTLSGDNNLATVTGQTGTARGETYEVAVSENAVKAVAQTAAQDAVKVTGTGLASVSDATAAGVKTYTVNVDEGKLVIDDTTGKLGATGASQGATQGKNGVATTQDVASVVNSAIDKTKQALDDAEHKFDGDTGTTSVRKHGEVLSIKGGVTTPADLTTGNIGVVSDGAGTLNIRLAKTLTGLTSATYTDGSGNTQTVTGGSSTITDGAGNTTTITKGGVTTTDGTNTTTVAPSGVTATDGTHTVTLGGSGINAGGTEIKNVGKATSDDAAVNKKQMDDAVKAATDSVSTLGDNKVSLGSDAGTTNAKKLSTTGGITFNIKGETGANALITTSATGDDVTIAPTTKLSAAVTAAEKSADKDLSNLSAAGDTYIKNLAKTAASWNVETNGAGTTAVAGGESVNFINGDNIAITNAGRAITIGTAKNVSFDKVTVGGVVLDKTDGINAGGKEIKGIAAGTAADSAVSKGQMETAIANAQTAATSTEKVIAKALTGDTNLATVTGQTGTAKGETYEVAVSENAVKNVAKAAAQDAVTVTGTGLATVSDNTAAGVKTYTVNVGEGKLVIDDTTGKLGANGATQGTTAGKNGVATTQDVASVVNSAIDKTKQALDDAEHKFDGDTGTTSVRKHGEVLSIKGGVTTPADLTTGNIGVVSDGAGTLNVRLAKVLTGLTSATYTDGAGNTQTVTGDSSTITDGAGNTTTMTKGGLSTTDGKNTTTVAPTGVTATDGSHTVKLEGTGIDAGNTELKNVAAGTAATSAVNKQQMEDAVKAGGTWKVTTNTGATTEVTGGDTVDFINGDNITITNTGRNITIGTAKNVSFDKVTVGGVTIDKTDGINAGGKEIKGIADGTAADSAVSKGQMDAAIANAQTAATSTEKVVAKTLTGDNNLATVTGQTGTAKNETYEVAVSENAVKAVATNAAQDAVKVAGTGLATVSDVTAAGVKTYTVNVDEGKLVLDDATGTIGAAGSTQGTTAGKDGVATTQNVAKAINDAVTKANANNAQALADAEHKFDGDTGTTSVRKHGEVLSIKGGVTTPADLTTGNIGVVSDGAGTLNVKLAKVLSGLTSATYTDGAGNTQTVTGASSTITDGAGNTTSMTKGGLSTTDGTNTTTVTPNGMTATDGTNTVKVEGSGIDAGNTEIKNVAAGTTNTSAVNKKQMDDAISKATGDATHEFGGDDTVVVSRKHGEKLNIKGGASTTAADLTDGNIAVLGDATTGTLNLKLAKALTGLTSATYTDGAGNTQTVTGASSTITDGAGKTTSMTKDGLSTTDGTKTTTVAPSGVTATDGTHTVKLEGTGIDAGNTELKNVAAGKAATSAVNKQQMEDAISKATGDATHEFGGDDTTVVSRKHGEKLNIKGGASTTAADLTDGNIAVLGDATTGTLNLKLAKALTGLTSATYTDAAGNTTTVTGGTTTIADATGNTQTLAPTKSEIKDNAGVSTVTTKDGVTAKDGSGNTTALTKGGVSATDGNGHTTDLTKGGLSTTDGTNTTTVTPNGMTATDGTNTVKVEGSGIDAGGTEIKNVAAGTTNTSAVNKKQMDDAISKATGDATHEFGGDDTTVVSRKHGEKLNIKGGASTTAADLTDGNIAVLGDATTGTLNLKLAKALTGLTSATYTDAAGNTTTVTGGTTTIADAAGNTQTLAPTKSEIKDNAGVSTVTTKDGVTAKDAAGNTTALTNGGVSTTDGVGNTTALTKGGLSTTDGKNTTTVAPNGLTATDGTNTVKVEGTGIDAGNTEIKNVAAGTTATSAVNKGQMDDAISKATGDATHEFGGDDTTVVSRKHGEKLNIKGGASTATADLTDGNIAVLGDATTGALNLKLAKALTGLTSATYTDAAGNTTTVTGGTTTIADAAGNTQTLAPTKSEIKDNAGVSTVTTKDGVTAKDGSGNTTALTKGGVSATDGNGHTTDLTKGGLSTIDGTNTTTVAPNGLTATDGTNTVKVEGSGIDAGNTEIKNVAAGTTNTSAVNKKQMDDAISKATGDATHEFGGDDTVVVSRKHGEKLNIKGGASTTAADLTDGNIAVLGDATTGTLNLKLAKALTGLTSATYTDVAGNTTTVTGGTTTIADAAGNTQTLAPTKSEIKDNAGVSTVTTKDGVTAKDAAGNTTALTNGGVSTTDGAGNTAALTKGGLSTTDGKNTTTVAPTGMTATDGTHTVKVEGTGIDAGNTEIKNVAAGTTATSAVNKGQMDDAISKATADATHEFAGDTGNNSVRKHGEVLSIKGGVTDTNKLSDNNIGVVSDGAGTLNVKLAKDLKDLTSATYKDTAGNTTTVTGGTTTIADASGNTQTLSPTKSEIKDNAGVSTVTTKDGVTAKDGSGNTTSLTKGGLSTTDGTNTTTVTPNGLTVTDGTNAVKVNGSGIDAGNTEIKNVADGTTPHSAINKNQLDAAVNQLQNATDNLSLNVAGNNGTGNVKLKDQVLHIDGTNGITTKANGQSVTVGLDDSTMNTINNTAALANNAAKKDLSNVDQAGKSVIKDTAAWNVKVNSATSEVVKGGDTVTFNDGHNIMITNNGKDITVATKKEVTFDKVSVGGITIDKQADHISGVSSITGSGSGAPTMTFNAPNGSTPANVSMNSNLDMGGKQITNVGPATRPTDAVNKQQVDQAMKSLAGMADNAAKQYASKAGANAAALAALKPIQYDPLAPTQIMAGIGNYKSQTAVALGVAYYSNEDTMFNIGASLDSKDTMLNAGVTHKFGSSAERKAIPERYKGGPISSIYVMQDEVSTLKAQNSQMQALLDKQSSENAAIVAENKVLREQNEEMQRKVDLILSKLQ